MENDERRKERFRKRSEGERVELMKGSGSKHRVPAEEDRRGKTKNLKRWRESPQ